MQRRRMIMDYTARYGLEFNPFLKNSKEVLVGIQGGSVPSELPAYHKRLRPPDRKRRKRKDHRCQELGFGTEYFPL